MKGTLLQSLMPFGHLNAETAAPGFARSAVTAEGGNKGARRGEEVHDCLRERAAWPQVPREVPRFGVGLRPQRLLLGIGGRNDYR